MVNKFKFTGINSDSAQGEKRTIWNPTKHEIVQVDSNKIAESSPVLKGNLHKASVICERNRFGVSQVVIVLD